MLPRGDGLLASSVGSPEVVAAPQAPPSTSEYSSVTSAGSDSGSIRVKETVTDDPVTAVGLEMPSASGVLTGASIVAAVGLLGSRSSPTWWFSQKYSGWLLVPVTKSTSPSPSRSAHPMARSFLPRESVAYNVKPPLPSFR